VVWANLVSHDRLLDGGQVLQRGQQNMTPLGTADVVDEASQLLAESYEHLIFVLDRFCRQREGALGQWGYAAR